MKKLKFLSKFFSITLVAALSISQAHAITGLVDVSGEITDYISPDEFADVFGGVIGQPFDAQLIIPNLESYSFEEVIDGASGFTGIVTLDGSMENSPGFILTTPTLRGLEGNWAQFANPEFNPEAAVCNSWEVGTSCTELNQPYYWSIDADFDGLLGYGELEFTNGSPTSFTYVLGRDVLETYDEFINEISVPGFGIQEIHIVATDISLVEPIAENGWQSNGNAFANYTAGSVEATVTAVPWPASHYMLMCGLLIMGWGARKRKQ